MRRLITVLAIETMLTLTLMLVLMNAMSGEDSTLTALGYSEPAFALVREGDTRARVTALLDEPLVAYAHSRYKGSPLVGARTSSGRYWLYTAPGSSPGSWAYAVRAVVFDSRGRVVRKEAFGEGD